MRVCFAGAVTTIPAPFQQQILGGSPDWLQKVINGEVITGGAERESGEGEECVIS